MMTDCIRKTGLLLVAAAALGACATTANVTVDNSSFPTVVAKPRDLSAVIVMDQEFRKFRASPLEKAHIGFGAAQVDLWTKAFDGLFARVEIVESKAQAGTDADLVIVPSVQEVQLSTPNQSYLNVYEVWIKYRLDIETPDGVPIDSWFLPAYGKTPSSAMMSRSRAIEDATVIALRDAGAKLLLDFYRIPAVHVWLEQRLAAADS